MWLPTLEREQRSVTLAESDWLVCGGCGILLYGKRFVRLGMVCPDCGRHTRLTSSRRLELLLDAGSAIPIERVAAAEDPLSFADLLPYTERLAGARQRTGLDDAVQVVRGTVRGRPVVVAAMDFRFMGGSLGSAAGQAITTAAEMALADRVPLLLITASGGARMQEGALALMQMAKTANAMAALDEAGLLTITLVTDPTFGGVAASFATLADVIIAEPGARMGFAGPRVIEQTIRQRLPTGFQTAEFLLDHGLVDDVRGRAELPQVLGMLLGATEVPGEQWGELTADPVVRQPDGIPARPVAEIIGKARELTRPTMLDHTATWFDGFTELHGDRAGADCPAIVGGLAVLDGLPVMAIGHQKGHTTDELVRRDFGMPSPAGYRKVARLLRLAGKLGLPVITLVDTPGAHPGLDAERHGQSIAIAECLRVLGGLPVPVVSVITGEGGSGGALALAVADRVLICENAIYSVISPEGCAAILWREAGAVPDAAAALRLEARSLLELGIVDAVVPEQAPIRDAVICALRELRQVDGPSLVSARRTRFRRFGVRHDQ
ncbi:carboxyl transferase domain-containing protein [Amycolatopsis sp. lyj-90]|uniref:carboxyl transferase domain-containing protein n=1 Tax=Amycolatopsis sp. lyj-90 TaxID=2789285 RepID=UPI00397BF67E